MSTRALSWCTSSMNTSICGERRTACPPWSINHRHWCVSFADTLLHSISKLIDVTQACLAQREIRHASVRLPMRRESSVFPVLFGPNRPTDLIALATRLFHVPKLDTECSQPQTYCQRSPLKTGWTEVVGGRRGPCFRFSVRPNYYATSGSSAREARPASSSPWSPTPVGVPSCLPIRFTKTMGTRGANLASSVLVATAPFPVLSSTVRGATAGNTFE